MSLLDEAMETFAFLNKSVVADGYGGYATTWTEGASFQGAIADMTSNEVLVAQQRGTHASYKLVAGRAVPLAYGDVVVRKSLSRYYRITENGIDKATPESATLDMRVVSVEELASLPS